MRSSATISLPIPARNRYTPCTIQHILKPLQRLQRKARPLYRLTTLASQPMSQATRTDVPVARPSHFTEAPAQPPAKGFRRIIEDTFGHVRMATGHSQSLGQTMLCCSGEVQKRSRAGQKQMLTFKLISDTLVALKIRTQPSPPSTSRRAPGFHIDSCMDSRLEVWAFDLQCLIEMEWSTKRLLHQAHHTLCNGHVMAESLRQTGPLGDQRLELV